MKIKIEEKTENPLLNRQDITFQVDHSGSATPPRSDVRAKLAAMLNCKEDQLYITKLDGQYGQSATLGYAHLYPSKEVAVTHEQSHIIKRHPAEEAAPSPPKEPAAPAPEEKKEEAKKPSKEEPAKTPPKESAKPPMKEEKKGTPTQDKSKKEESKAAPQKEEKSKKEKPSEEKPDKGPKEKKVS